MAEPIDVACDICGQKYRWSDERIGKSATCKTCGTAFEVVEYVAPSEDEQSAGHSALQWIKGTSITVLILLMLAGLGSLPFNHPQRSHPVIVGRPQPALGAEPANLIPVPSRDMPPAHQFPQSPDASRERPESIPKLEAPAGHFAQVPDPHVPAIPNSPRSAFPRSNEFVPIPPAKKGEAAEGTGESPGIAPMITKWNITKKLPFWYFHLEGEGLRHVGKVQQFGGHILNDVQFEVISDKELEVKTFLPDFIEPLLAISSPDGMAVVFSAAVKTVETAETVIPESPADRLRLVKKGGHMESNSPMVVLVEEGGRADIDSFTTVCFLKREAKLQTRLANMLYAEAGALVAQSLGRPQAIQVPKITFCQIPAP